MTSPADADFWLKEQAEGRRLVICLCVGLMIELAALGLLARSASHRPPTPSDHPAPIRLSILAPAPPKPPAPPKTAPPKPAVPRTAPPVPAAPPLPLPPPAPDRAAPRHAPHQRRVAPPRAVPPAAPPSPPQPPQPPPAPAPSTPAPSAGALDVFQAAMRRAVQERANGIEPGAALIAQESGVVKLRFIYLNGAVSQIIVAASSGFPLLDEAAVQAARTATYPPAPPELAGQPREVMVDIVFATGAPGVDSD